MFNRRQFVAKSLLASLGLGLVSCDNEKEISKEEVSPSSSLGGAKPLVIATWNHGLIANEKAWEILSNNGRALDAVEEGVKVVEADPKGTTVGIGGTPDRDGHVTLDACIMDEKGNAGAVCFIENIKHPISVARKVMEETPHVMLAGEGALQFAKEQGFKEEKLLTEKSEKAWEEWKEKSKYEPIINVENHDTISQLAIDKNGDISGSCTTSGLGYKMRGRVGDSPIIGASLFVDNEVGAACATGLGEVIMKTLGSFLIVEFMRNGLSPNEACKKAVMRIIKKYDYKDLQVGYLAINKSGEYGGYSIHEGFSYAICVDGKNEMVKTDYYVKGE
ncbi:MAG: isoaspartyl peptidase/L-asparaginase family protein [Saprospiraceae bacterium]